MRRVIAIAVVLCVGGSVFGDANSGYDRDKGKRLFYRMLGSQSNGPYVRKTRTVAAPDGATSVGTTGMANAGYTEYPFCSEKWSFGFREYKGLYPRIASGVEMDTSRVNTCDILVDWVYEPDGVVWGPACKEFGQSFVAKGRELVGMTMLVASPMAEFTVAVHEGGISGKEVVPRRKFKSGSSMEWGHVRWAAGEGVLRRGQRYYVRIWREDRQAWNPYFHSTGDAYADGMAYFDRVERVESDLAIWIMEEPEDLRRSLVAGRDEDGWVRGVKGVHLVPRSRNIRLITADVQPVKEFCHHIVAYVWQDESKQELVCGPKYCHACARVNTSYEASFMYGPGEFDCEVGRSYYVEIFTVGFEEGKSPVIPDDRSDVIRRDLLVRAYGETAGDSAVVLYNLRAEPLDEKELAVSWQLSKPAVVELAVGGGKARRRVSRLGSELIGSHVVKGLGGGQDVDFRVTASSADGGQWRSPLYRVRMPGGDAAEALWPETPEWFVPLAPRPELAVQGERLGWFRKNLIADGDFEEGLGHWRETKDGIAAVSGGDGGIEPVQGRKMYGFTHRAGAQRKDVLLRNGIGQGIKTKAGRRYEVSLRAITEVGDGPKGDTRVSIAVDPAGGEDFAGRNSSQWFWTDGKWRRLTHTFVADSDTATVQVDFFRWRDLDAASAYIDDVRVYEVGR